MLTLLVLWGCQTTTPTISTDRDVCRIWTPLLYHGKTTDPDTIKRIRALNAKHDAFCGKKP